MRLPFGFSALRQDLGSQICAGRKARRLKQTALADDIGIRRETLSRIERGKQTPRPRVLDALMAALYLEWEEIAERGGAASSPRVFEDGTRGDALIALGQQIQRRRTGLSLRALGAHLDLSAAHLSRVERGQVLHSHLFRDHPDDLAFDREDRRIQVIDGKLEAFLRGDAD